MSARQIRLSTMEAIRTQLKEYTGRKINIVLNDRTVLFGELKTVDNDNINFHNMRREPVTLSLTEISEIYLDVK